VEDNALDKAHHLLGANFGHCLSSIHLVNLSTMTSKWVKPPDAFLKGPKRSRPHTEKGHAMEMVWSSWDDVWTCLAKYWHPLQDLTI
jgi:hypothetical protein